MAMPPRVPRAAFAYGRRAQRSAGKQTPVADSGGLASSHGPLPLRDRSPWDAGGPFISSRYTAQNTTVGSGPK
uniref:Uncharacterized protein n=1 Tax=Oryza brachyantha TaxID=4533 RepID=J3LFL8_ORYBR